MRTVLLLTLLLTPFLSAFSQNMPADSVAITPDHYRVYTADGTPATLEDVFAAMDTVDVVFVGEEHNDPVAHYLQKRLLEEAYARYGATRPVALSLEQFARDAQLVLDEYLAGLITEKAFRAESRPWKNYETDYRPLVEFARAHGLDVIAANAPRRYVNRVTRLGPASLDSLSDRAKAYLPPLPYAPATPAYKAKWDSLMAASMAEMAAMRDTARHAMPADTAHAAGKPAAPMHAPTGHMLDAQSLWDASMAYSVADYLTRHPGALVLHMVGGFHVEKGVGTPDHLRRYRPGVRILNVAVRPSEDLHSFDAKKYAGLGDFVILTDESLPRTFESM